MARAAAVAGKCAGRLMTKEPRYKRYAPADRLIIGPGLVVEYTECAICGEDLDYCDCTPEDRAKLFDEVGVSAGAKIPHY